MNINTLTKRAPVRLALFILIYLLAAAFLFWVIGDDWSMTAARYESVSPTYLLSENSTVSQTLTLSMDAAETINLYPHFSSHDRTGSVSFSITKENEVLWTQDVDASTLASDELNTIAVQPALYGVGDGEVTLTIDPNETGLSMWAGASVQTGKFDIAVSTSGLTIDGAAAEGSLALEVTGHILLGASQWYWPVVLVLLAVAVALICLTQFQLKQGKRSLLTLAVTVFRQYRYLLKQLVDRDFRVKYKSSALGMVWSLLNPLLTMLVYLFVFSTLFKSNIEHFPVYLMSGIVLFNYFSESTNLGMGSIVGNSALITKVYMPKLIYPLSKVLSAAINFCISLIPLCLVMVITGITIHKSILLLPVVVAFLIVFSFGMSLILATMNVFFRDTQFLWGVLLMMLNFLTPLFYPESIIPEAFLPIYRCNPLYQIIFFMRSIIINGVSPTPATYLYCILSCGVTLLLGLWIFRKNQDRFVLYL